MKEKNSGFSLIELIIAISILLILSGMVFLGINASKRKNTEKSARELCNQLQLLRTVSMSKAGEWRLSLYERDSRYYCVQERLTEEGDSFSWKTTSEEIKLGYKGDIFFVLEQDMDALGGDGNDEKKDAQEADANGRDRGTVVRRWKFDRDTGACISGSGIINVSGTGRTMEVAVYPENGRCEARAKAR